MTIVNDLRVRLGLEPKLVAESAGISLAEYYDLESIDDELHIAASVATIARVARALGVKPSAFYEGSSDHTLTLSELASLILQYLERTATPITQLEETVGWNLQKALGDPNDFLEFNADGLRDVCRAVGLNWLDALDGISSSIPATPATLK